MVVDRFLGVAIDFDLEEEWKLSEFCWSNLARAWKANSQDG